MIALLFEAALRSLALGGLIWLAMLAVRPRNPHLQKTVWLTVLLASIAMPFVLLGQLAPSFDTPAYLATLTQVDGAAAVSAHGTESRSASSMFAALPVGAITAAYAIVALALLARFAVGLISIRRIRQAAAPLARNTADAFDIRISPKVLSPATFGSTILLPASASEWSESKLAAVLAHEQSHVRHKDCYVQWLARLHAGVFWFNPLAWWLQRRLSDLAETTSDDAAIQAIADRTAYADLLLDIARNAPASRVVMSAARPNISARIEHIISNVPPAAPPRRWVRGLAVAIVIPPFTMAAATLQAPEDTRNAPMEAPHAQEPQVIEYGELAELQKYYPPNAMRAGVEALVKVSVTLDPAGHVTDARVLEQNPADTDWGFADAATAVAKTLRFSNPAGTTTQTNVRVKFALNNGPRANEAAPASSSPP